MYLVADYLGISLLLLRYTYTNTTQREGLPDGSVEVEMAGDGGLEEAMDGTLTQVYTNGISW
jgi:hypothetical protein